MKLKYIVISFLLIFLWGCSSTKPLVDNAKLIKPVIENGIMVQNAGHYINTEYDEYSPAITGDGKILYFTSNRPNPSSAKSGDEDIWYSYKDANGWSFPANLGTPINSIGNQGQTSFQPDGQYVYFVLPERKDGFGNFDIYYSYLQGSVWSEPKNIGNVINSEWWDSQPAISSDGRILIFASNRPGGFGGSDLWMSIKDVSGSWTKPFNLGPNINTTEDEVSPFLALDNMTLYFSSKADPSLGGFDIFTSQFTNGMWSEKKNIGSPYNSEKDDFSIIFPASSDTAYLASNRSGSIDGSLDIWMAVPPPKAKYQPAVVVAVTGIVSEFNSKPKRFIEADLIIKDLSTDTIISQFKSNSANGKYYVVLSRGKNYGITAKAPGYLFHSSQFEIPANAEYKEYKKDIELFPLKGEKPTEKPSVRLMVFFDYDKADLRPESYTDLNNAIEFLQANPNVYVTIAGHTDKRGSDEYNDKLSQERSNSVASYIIVKGSIDPNRVKPVGFGKRKLLFEGDTEEIHQANRRVIMVLEKY
jgi:outer membrane protein OmpA-like peptidoglycan-associated protein